MRHFLDCSVITCPVYPVVFFFSLILLYGSSQPLYRCIFKKSHPTRENQDCWILFPFQFSNEETCGFFGQVVRRGIKTEEPAVEQQASEGHRGPRQARGEGFSRTGLSMDFESKAVWQTINLNPNLILRGWHEVLQMQRMWERSSDITQSSFGIRGATLGKALQVQGVWQSFQVQLRLYRTREKSHWSRTL